MAVTGQSENRTRRVFSVLVSAAFLLLAPGTVAGFVPWWISGWRVHAPFPGFAILRIIGVILIVAGIPVLLESFVRFVVQGLGTPMPLLPPQHLVVKGFYRFVRNPMYVAVLTVILGQALLLGNVGILEYTACAWLGFHLWVLGYEEPKLQTTFGTEYQTFCFHVPRWIPRLSPWREDAE